LDAKAAPREETGSSFEHFLPLEKLMLLRADIADHAREPIILSTTTRERLAVGLFALAIAAVFLWLLLAATGNFSEPVTFGSLAFRPAAVGSCV
jgi:hypothetical protein